MSLLEFFRRTGIESGSLVQDSAAVVGYSLNQV